MRLFFKPRKRHWISLVLPSHRHPPVISYNTWPRVHVSGEDNVSGTYIPEVLPGTVFPCHSRSLWSRRIRLTFHHTPFPRLPVSSCYWLKKLDVSYFTDTFPVLSCSRIFLNRNFPVFVWLCRRCDEDCVAEISFHFATVLLYRQCNLQPYASRRLQFSCLRPTRRNELRSGYWWEQARLPPFSMSNFRLRIKPSTLVSQKTDGQRRLKKRFSWRPTESAYLAHKGHGGGWHNLRHLSSR